MKHLLAAFALIVCCSSCDILSVPPLSIPNDYPGASFQTLASEELSIIAGMNDLEETLIDARDENNSFSVDALGQLFLSGNPSLSSYTNESFRTSVDNWLIEVAAASGNSFSLSQAPQGNGGVDEGYLLNGNGQDPGSLILKGLHTAMLYYNAVRLSYAQVDTAVADKLLAMYGAHPDMPNSYNADQHSNPDRFIAAMAAARDENNGTGYYSIIREGLIQLKAASPFPFDYAFEIDEARQHIRFTLELVLASTVVHELQNALDLLEQSNPSDADLVEAVHRISNATGIMAGFRMLPAGYRLITDPQAESVLEELLSEPGQASMIYEFASNPADGVDKLEDAIDLIQFVYGFSDAELIAFKKDWVAEQSR